MNITALDVFEFAGTQTEERTSAKTNAVNSMLTRVTDMIETWLGRNIEPKLTTALKIHDGRYCDIRGRKIYLNDRYYDIASITTLKEDDVTLTENTNFVITKPNIIERIDNVWSQGEQLNIELTGYFGMGTIDGTEGTPPPAIEEIILETVAVLSGVWGKVVSDGEGNPYEVLRSGLPRFTQDALKAYKQIPVL